MLESMIVLHAREYECIVMASSTLYHEKAKHMIVLGWIAAQGITRKSSTF